jgi:hypothetical protein
MVMALLPVLFTEDQERRNSSHDTADANDSFASSKQAESLSGGSARATSYLHQTYS